MKCFYEEEELPDKLIAIYSDGSGCEMFFKDKKLYYPVSGNHNGVDSGWFVDAGFLWFFNLPDDFEFFTHNGIVK